MKFVYSKIYINNLKVKLENMLIFKFENKIKLYFKRYILVNIVPNLHYK